MAAMMKKQMLASTTTKRSAVVAQAKKTVSASKTSDSMFYGPNRGQFLGPFSESQSCITSSCSLMLSFRMHDLIRPRTRSRHPVLPDRRVPR